MIRTTNPSKVQFKHRSPCYPNPEQLFANIGVLASLKFFKNFNLNMEDYELQFGQTIIFKTLKSTLSSHWRIEILATKTLRAPIKLLEVFPFQLLFDKKSLLQKFLELQLNRSCHCCVFRPANACLHMHVHGRKRQKTDQQTFFLVFFISLLCSSRVHDEKVTFFIIFECYLSFSTMRLRMCSLVKIHNMPCIMENFWTGSQSC